MEFQRPFAAKNLKLVKGTENLLESEGTNLAQIFFMHMLQFVTERI